MTKRGTNTLPDEVLNRIVELRAGGATMTAISAETKAALASVHRVISAAKADGRLQVEIEAATSDRDLADDYRATARSAIAETRRYIAYAKQNGAGMDPGDRAKVQREIRESMNAAMKWRLLLQGRPTAHTKSERASEPTETPEQKATRERLERLAGDGEIN